MPNFNPDRDIQQAWDAYHRVEQKYKRNKVVAITAAILAGSFGVAFLILALNCL